MDRHTDTFSGYEVAEVVEASKLQARVFDDESLIVTNEQARIKLSHEKQTAIETARTLLVIVALTSMAIGSLITTIAFTVA